MERESIWLVPHPTRGWGVRREDSTRWLARAPRKDAAERAGRLEAKRLGCDLVITRKDGTIEQRIPYAADGSVLPLDAAPPA